VKVKAHNIKKNLANFLMYTETALKALEVLYSAVMLGGKTHC